LNVLGFLALFVLFSKQLPFFKMSYLFVYMKLESLPPTASPPLYRDREFNPVQFLAPYFLAVLFDMILYYQRALSMWVFRQNFV
jgi:hypothetical protein